MITSTGLIDSHRVRIKERALQLDTKVLGGLYVLVTFVGITHFRPRLHGALA